MIQSKIKGIKTIIRRGLKYCNNPYIACSFGKDSTVLLYFILQQRPDIPVVFLKSDYELPEIYEFSKWLKKEWKLNLTEIDLKLNHIEVCKKIGLQHERKYEVANFFKKKPLQEYALKNNYDGVFWGLRKDESNLRRKIIKYQGVYSKGKDGIKRISPLAFISNYELWLIIDLLKIPYCDLYKKTKFFKRENLRNDGWLATNKATKGRLLHLKYYYPEYFKKIEQNFPEIRWYL